MSHSAAIDIRAMPEHLNMRRTIHLLAVCGVRRGSGGPFESENSLGVKNKQMYVCLDPRVALSRDFMGVSTFFQCASFNIA